VVYLDSNLHGPWDGKFSYHLGIFVGIALFGLQVGRFPSKHMCDQGQDHSLPTARSLYVENDKIVPYLICLYVQV